MQESWDFAQWIYGFALPRFSEFRTIPKVQKISDLSVEANLIIITAEVQRPYSKATILPGRIQPRTWICEMSQR